MNQRVPFNISEIGSRLRKIRDRERLSQQAFASLVDASPRTYQYYEHGEKLISSDVIARVFEHFGDDPGWLLTGTRDANWGFLDPELLRGILLRLRDASSAHTNCSEDEALVAAVKIYNLVSVISDPEDQRLAIERAIEMDWADPHGAKAPDKSRAAV